MKAALVSFFPFSTHFKNKDLDHIMPKIGMRIVKTALAVFLCFLIDLLRNHQGAPFYSAIAAILCMQPFVSNSVKVAFNRSVGTFIGGLFGMLVLLAERAWLPKGSPSCNISLYPFA